MDLDCRCNRSEDYWGHKEADRMLKICTLLDSTRKVREIPLELNENGAAKD